MNKEKLVEEYYNKLVRYVRKESRGKLIFKSLSSIICPIKKTIRKIIDDNNHYLLTDDYLNVLAHCAIYWVDFRETIYKSLARIANNNHAEIIKEMKDHIHRLTVRRDSRDNIDHIIANTRPDMIEMLNEYLEILHNIWNNYEGNDKPYDARIVEALLERITACCIIDNEIDRYHDYASVIFSDFTRCSEFLKLNNVKIYPWDDEDTMNDFLEAYPVREIYNHMKGETLEKRILL